MIRRAVGVLGELLVTAGVLTLLFVVWQLHWTDLTSERAQAAAVDALQERWDATPAPTASAAAPSASAAPAVPDVDQSPPTGDAFAIVYVPRFGSDYAVPVVEGIGAEELEDGIGHYPGTAVPGAVGNFAIAGHRVTYGKPFNRVAELQEGDAVVVATAERWYTYRVRRHRIVSPTAVEITAPVPDRPGEQPTEAWLTMTACHPMYSARQRYIVYAQLESSQDRAAGPPASLAAVG
ncbi:class E sortase [Kineococcus arenarius]|uniref:class E sortase n=1 Tax=Kineococcus sp. SYSU DK007 TaxID=3383128 RepID=UPI003D7CE819